MAGITWGHFIAVALIAILTTYPTSIILQIFGTVISVKHSNPIYRLFITANQILARQMVSIFFAFLAGIALSLGLFVIWIFSSWLLEASGAIRRPHSIFSESFLLIVVLIHLGCQFYAYYDTVREYNVENAQKPSGNA